MKMTRRVSYRFSPVSLFSFLVIGISVVAAPAFANNDNMYDQDYNAMLSALTPMFSTPTAQAKSWTGANGDGDIRVSLAISSSQGLPCDTISSCEKPCRNYTYTFIGEHQDGWIVNEERTGRVCYASSRWTRVGSETTKKSRRLNKSQRLTDAENKARAQREQQAKLERERQAAAAEAARVQAAAERERARAQEQRNAQLAASNQERANIVTELQSSLNALKYDVGSPDGSFGEQTRIGLTALLDDARITDVEIGNVPTNTELGNALNAIKSVIAAQEDLKACVSAAPSGDRICAKVL